MVGHGAVNKKMEANGAIVEHASTTTGATVAARALDEVVAVVVEDAAATLANVVADRKAMLFV